MLLRLVLVMTMSYFVTHLILARRKQTTVRSAFLRKHGSDFTIFFTARKERSRSSKFVVAVAAVVVQREKKVLALRGSYFLFSTFFHSYVFT